MSPGASGGVPKREPIVELAENRTLAAKLVDAALDVESVSKRGTNTFHKYSYATAEDVALAATKALLKHRVLSDFEVVGYSFHDHPGDGMLVTVKGRLIITDADSGKQLIRLAVGSGHDKPGDKAVLKAMTAARKYAYLHLLGIPIGDDPEDERGVGRTRREASAPQLDKERVEALLVQFKAHKQAKGHFTFGDFDLLLGALGIDSLRAHSPKAVKERLSSLTEEQASALEAELEQEPAE